jgi:molecular chaperone DnaJ
VRLNSRQKELLQEFQETLEKGGESHSPKAHSWLSGVKRFFDDMKQNIGS